MKNGNFRKLGLVLLAVLLAGLFSANIVGAGQNRCLPDWSSAPIVIDKEIKRIEFAPGDSFSVEANYRYASSCKNYVSAVLTWQAFKNNVVTNDIVFSDSHAKKTTATVISVAKTGDRISIRGILTFADEPNGVRSEREETSIFIVDKPPAPKIELNYGSAESFKRFYVSFEDSKAYGSRNNFIRNCSLVLKDEQGNIADVDEVKTVFQKPMPVAKLKANKPGIHTISASCSDSHGTIGRVIETIPIDISDSKRNTPFLIVNKTINCKLGDCVADFSRTNAFGKELKVEYIDVTNANIRNPLAVKCGNEVCRLNLTRPGVYKIKLVAKFLLSSDANGFYYSDKSEETIQVYVSQQTQAQQATVQAATPAATVQAFYNQPAAPISATPSTATSDDGCEGYRCKSSPGAGGFALIAILAILARRIKK